MPNLHDAYPSLNKIEAAANAEDGQHVKLKAEIGHGRDNNSRLTYNSSLRMKINDSQLRSQSHPMTNLNRNAASNEATATHSKNAEGNLVRKSSFALE